MLPVKLSNSAKPLPVWLGHRRLLLVIAALVSVTPSAARICTAQTPGETVVFPTTIQWNQQRSANWYRLQIAGDEGFRDTVLDRRITGGRYTFSDLPPGYYYWRVAPTDRQLGVFTRTMRVFVSGGVVTASFFRGASKVDANMNPGRRD